MNPLTQIKNTQKVTKQEIAAGVTDSGSWHARFKHSAYIYAGGLPYQLTEGDLLAVFSQYGEVVDVNLVKDRDTGKSRGFAFLAYEDQRSTVLAVDNLSGARVAGRVIRVDHVDNYKIKRAEVEGREVSDSEEEEDEEDNADAAAQDAAVQAAQLEGATVERITSGAAAGTSEEDVWAGKSSVLVALQEAGPMRAQRPHAEHDAEDPMRGMQLGDDDEDPMLRMSSGKKAKKEKKEMKKKDRKEKKQKGKKDKADDGDDRPASELARDATEGVAASAAPNGTLHADGSRRSIPDGKRHPYRGERGAPSRDPRDSDGRGRHEQERRRGRKEDDDRYRERRRSRDHGPRDSERHVGRHTDERRGRTQP